MAPPRVFAMLVVLATAALFGPPAWSQGPQAPLRITPTPNPPAPDERVGKEQDLERLRADQKKSAEQSARLAAEVEALGQDRRKLSRALIDTAERLREIEGRAAAAEVRLQGLDASEGQIRTRLEGRRAVIVELLAALQRIGRRPPPALMVRPEDALQSVRTAILLGAVVPEMRIEADALSADLAALVALRREIDAERGALARDLASQTDERQRMTLLVEERQKRQAEAEKALETEKQRAMTLARQAESLKDLIAKLEQARGGTEGKETAPAPGRNNVANLRDGPRLGPAVAFANAKGALRLPVNGAKVRNFGATDSFGGLEKGLSIATRPAAQVTAPCDGKVVYAGPFRSYGQLLILDAGGGYHVLLAGMERMSVELGQYVLTGEPVATMGGNALTAAASVFGGSQPILYVEFRKDGTPVDPTPWWAATDSEKVRG